MHRRTFLSWICHVALKILAKNIYNIRKVGGIFTLKWEKNEPLYLLGQHPSSYDWSQSCLKLMKFHTSFCKILARQRFDNVALLIFNVLLYVSIQGLPTLNHTECKAANGNHQGSKWAPTLCYMYLVLMLQTQKDRWTQRVEQEYHLWGLFSAKCVCLFFHYLLFF